MDRRTLLKSIGALAATPLLRGCASDPGPLSETIDTVVILMLENRSFDHYFGALSLVEGRADVDGLTSAMSNPNTAGQPIAPAPADASCIEDPGHAWNASHRQFNDGANDGFVKDYEERLGSPEHAHRVMDYLDRAALPAMYTLADHYTVCQRWFCSLMAGTWPNRFYSLSGQSKGVRTNDETGVYDMLTIYDALRPTGRSWGIYYGNISFSTLFTGNYPREQFHPIEKFFEDAAAAKLPNVTIVEPIYGRNDDHPPLHPLAGQIFVAQIYDALASSPQWNRSLMIVTYDEHGGFYDHVPPPKAQDERAAEGFDQLGFRVPTLIVGPYVKKAFASDTTFDHTSILRTVHTLFGSRPLTARDRTANDVLSVLDPALLENKTPAPPAALAPIEADEAVIYGPGCTRDLGLFQPRPGSLTGQAELESWLDRQPARHPLDRRHQTDEIYESLLRRAEKRGILKRRTKPW